MGSLASLIEQLKSIGVLRTPKIIRTFKKVDRKHFVPKELLDLAYVDEALPIGGGQTISQPYTVAFMLELLQARAGDRVLDVGSGSGFTTVLLAELVDPRGHVFGVETRKELVASGKQHVAKFHFSHAEIHEAGDILGLPEKAPFDKILVSASATELPKPLVDQLKSGGRMVIPVGGEIWKIEKKSNGSLAIEKHGGFVFVPLIETSA